MNPVIVKGITAVIPVLFSGCASYYTHYAVFSAQNSAGEERQFKLTWETADYPDWWYRKDQSTPITLETQCSSRKWRLVDPTHTSATDHSCAPGIRSCGSESTDQFAIDGSSDFEKRACMRINPQNPAALVNDISSSLELLVSCRPVRKTRQSGEETENIDYLLASPVPYTIYSRKGTRGRLDSKPPGLDDSICDDE